jgi:hypothetical protein
MIEAAFGAGAMAPARGAERRLAARCAARRGAIRLTTIAGGTNGEGAVAAPTGLLAKRRVHGVGARPRTDWTRQANRGTTEGTGSVCRSIEAVTEGLEGSAPGPHLFAAARSLRDGRLPAQLAQAVDAATPVDAQTAPTAVCKSRTAREIRTAPTAVFVCVEKMTDEELRPESRFTQV